MREISSDAERNLGAPTLHKSTIMAHLLRMGRKVPLHSLDTHVLKKEENCTETLCLMALPLTSPMTPERSTMMQGSQLMLSSPPQKHHHRHRQMEDTAGSASSHVSASMPLPGV